MANLYLNRRVDRYNRFKILLDRPQSKQCGRAFVLQINDGSTITPRLKFLGAGVYGAVFAVEHTYLAANNINAVINSYDSDGFTLLWTKNGSPTGTADILYLALG